MANPAALIRAKYQNATVVERGRTSIRHQLANGHFVLDSSIGALHISGTETEINSNWQATTGAWQYQMVTADFHLFSRNQLGVGTMYRYQDPATANYVEFQPLALNWVNDDDSRQQITQPQSVTAAVVDGDTLRFTNGYGTGRHFEYQAQTERLQKRIIIDSAASLPAPTVTGTPYLEIEFVITKSAGVTEWVDGVQWDRSTRVGTAERIEYRNAQEQRLWSFDYPRAWDSAGNETIGLMVLRRQGANRLVTVRVPKSWLDTAVYPITLDPTIDVRVAAATDDGRWSDNGNGYASVGLSVDAGYAFGGGWNIWFRYDNMTIPAGATINSAYLEIIALSTTTSAGMQLTIRAIDEADPAYPADETAAEAAARTTASTTWTVTNQTQFSVYQTADISAVIQELVDSYTYSGSEAMVFLIEHTGQDVWVKLQAYEYDMAAATLLHIDYTEAGGGNTYEMAATLTAISDTNTSAMQVQRWLVTTGTGVSDTTTANLQVIRPLSAILTGISNTGDISLQVIRALAAPLTAQSDTTTTALYVLRSVVATLTAVSDTNTAALYVLRPSSATLTAVSSTTEIDLVTAGLYEMVATLTAISNTDNAALYVLRPSNATLTAISSTSDIALLVSGIIEMAATLTAISSTNDIALSVLRIAIATLTAQSNTSNAELLKYLNSAAVLTAISDTNTLSLQVARQLSATLTAQSASNEAALRVIRQLSATLTAQSNTSDITLVTSIIAGIVTASFSARRPGAGFTASQPNADFET